MCLKGKVSLRIVSMILFMAVVLTGLPFSGPFSVVAYGAVSYTHLASVSLVGFLMFGNLIRECGVLERLSDTAQNNLAQLVTLLLEIGRAHV